MADADHKGGPLALPLNDVLGLVAWRFKFPTGGRWHYTEHGPNEASKPELTWEPLFGQAALEADNAQALRALALVNKQRDEIDRLRGALLNIADAARLSPYREANQWDDSLAKLIARKTDFLKA